MLVGIFGNMGSGKTLLLTMLTYLYKIKKSSFVATNYYNQISDLILSAEELLMSISDLNKSSTNLLALDEIGKIATATSWYTDINEIIGKIFTESRKKNFDIIYTSQSAMMVDRNIRRVTDIILLPQYNSKTSKVIVDYYEFRGTAWFKDEPFDFRGEQFFDFYNTDEVILPNKQAIVNYYIKQLREDKELYSKILACEKPKDRLEQLTFYMSIKLKLAKMMILEMDEFQ